MKIFFLCFRVGENETCINQYDIRDHSDSYPACGSKWPYELSDITQYLRVIEFLSHNISLSFDCNEKKLINFFFFCRDQMLLELFMQKISNLDGLNVIMESEEVLIMIQVRLLLP